MDLLLNICDDLFLDAFYAKALPLAAFAHETNASLSSAAPVILSALPKWHELVTYLPHPPLSVLRNMSSFAPAAAAAAEPALSAWPRDYIPRQLLSLSIVTLVGIHLLYFVFAALSYYFIFNHDMMRHPRFLKNQVRLEIQCSLAAFPVMTLLTLPIFEAEVLGWSKLYDDPAQYGYSYLAFSALLYVS
jgi:lathosterol oxidase